MHAAAAYFFSRSSRGIAGMRSDRCECILHAGHKLVESSSYLHMVAPRVYDRVAAMLFGTGLVGAGKLMGLAPME